MENSRLIKRYANRKLYDTKQSCYVTLEEIAAVIREGNDVTVIDNKTKEDITYRTLIQLLHVLETKHAHNGMVKDLNRVIRGQEGTFSGFIRELEGVEYVPPVKEVPAAVVASESQEAENTNTVSFN
ncbi:MAG: polyhydroxyalkanoate synthesis regulator DNA-binding domain-containing protein [Bacteriovoracaceae bacterium]